MTGGPVPLRVGVDIGGTFTDFVAIGGSEAGIRRLKLPSTPDDPADAVLRGLAWIAAAGRSDPAPERSDAETAPDPETLAGLEASVVHGSTVATNAVLERTGVRTALVTTRGFRDLLRIGRQNRTDIYDLSARRPPPLVPPELSFELSERVDRRGDVLEPLATGELEPLAGALAAAGVEAVAVSFLFSFLAPEHERRVAARLREAGFFVSASSEVLPEFREYERTSTTALDAYVTPVLDRYLARLERALPASELRIMHSNGGSATVAEARRHGVRSLLSGPAGGVVGARHAAREAGFEDVITFDMGGTSTDVSLARGELGLTAEGEIAGLPVRVPVVDLHSVGSGGGSIARIDAGGALRVGPQSAGADPGPVAYGRGGSRPTVTDAHVVLGRLPSDRFLGGSIALDREAAVRSLARLAAEGGLGGRGELGAAEVAALGVVRVAEARMARALRLISVERGHDPADFALVSFGGAGGLHACGLARSLGMRRVVVPRAASTLSALGMLAAPVVRDEVLTVMLDGRTPLAELERRIEPLVDRTRDEVARQGAPRAEVRVERTLEMRYAGQSYELPVALGERHLERFHAEHERAYGHADPTAGVEIVNLRVRAEGPVDAPTTPTRPPPGPDPEDARIGVRRVVVGGGERARRRDVPLFDGARLRAGERIEGPAVIVQPDTTVVLEPLDVGELDPRGTLVIEVGVEIGDGVDHDVGHDAGRVHDA